ncbi:DEP1 [Candida pseudojiufengensis]|uniref:DEP1 n=1 Tax=Candida pseudojiufengensis TaxID=497109 RepID=UPI002224DFBF|nr:DEP1 [Candida pseudojiufengensis]KAI5960546.1 DEP1 [Candida pseudojiufengensis]
MEIMESVPAESQQLKILDRTNDLISPPISNEKEDSSISKVKDNDEKEATNLDNESRHNQDEINASTNGKDLGNIDSNNNKEKTENNTSNSNTYIEENESKSNGIKNETNDETNNENNNENNNITISKDSPLTDIATSPPPFDSFNLDGELKNTLDTLDRDETFKTFQNFIKGDKESSNGFKENGDIKDEKEEDDIKKDNTTRINPQRKDSYESSELSEVGEDSEAETDKMDFLDDRDSNDKQTDLQTLSELTDLAKLEDIDFNSDDDIEVEKVGELDIPNSATEKEKDLFTKDELDDAKDELSSLITRKRTANEEPFDEEDEEENDKKKQKRDTKLDTDEDKEVNEDKEIEADDFDELQPNLDSIDEDREKANKIIPDDSEILPNTTEKQITPDDEENEAEAEYEEEDEDIEEDEEDAESDTKPVSKDSDTTEISKKEDGTIIEEKIAEEDDVDLNEQRRLAIEGLVAIEKCFAEVRDKLYEDKLALLEKELELCLEGSHPELSKIYYKVDSFYQDSLNLANSNLSYKLKCIDKETLATRTSIHQNYLKNIMDTKNEMITETTSMWYKINKERNQLDQIVPDFNYSAIPNNIINQEDITMGTSSTYLEAIENSTPKLRKAIKQNTIIELVQQRNNLNQQLGILNGLIQFHGFPSAISSSINNENDGGSDEVKELLLRKATDDEINEDLKAMGIIRT